MLKKSVLPLVGLEFKVTLKDPLPIVAVLCTDWIFPEAVVSDKEVGVKKETVISNAPKSIINIARCFLIVNLVFLPSCFKVQTYILLVLLCFSLILLISR
jgi:hypothetical protein